MDFKRILLLSAVLYAPLSGSAVITLIKTFSISYNVTLDYAGLVLTAYVIPFGVFQLFSGAIADAFSRRMSLVIGLFIFGLFGFVIALAPTFELILMARFFMGIAGSFQIPIVIAIVGDSESELSRGHAFGYLSIFINVGLAIGPLISGLTDVFISWQFFFYFIGAGAIINSILLFFYLPKDIHRDKGSFNEQVKLTLSNISQAMNYRQVWLFSVASLFAFGGIITTYVYLPTYMRDLGFLQDVAGFTISIAGVFGIIIGVTAGNSVDKFGRKAPLIFGLILGIIAHLLFFIFPSGLTNQILLVIFILVMAIIGTGLAFVQASMNTIANEIIPEIKATVSSFSSALRFIGFALLPLLATVYEDYGFNSIIIISTISIIIGIFLFIPLRTITAREKTNL